MSACGSSSTSSTTTEPASSAPLNTQQAKLSIEDTILEKRHVKDKVECPAEVVKQKGTKFVCVATAPNGTKTTFTVTELNNLGYLTYVGR